ncbi:hypothetical protein GALMADRAFT_714899 [Galerina marginata CBS 339.88]|uniref:Uncharacterized protein n=1 Tax=Galerina marginata (strain CBS 339.88) TaxID=685588 RepID=A0A067TMR1_GALM3|nr:hypothetical protein GALMADRAFT_714899 [Galerina marginata CBS 339.88]
MNTDTNMNVTTNRVSLTSISTQAADWCCILDAAAFQPRPPMSVLLAAIPTLSPASIAYDWPGCVYIPAYDIVISFQCWLFSTASLSIRDFSLIRRPSELNVDSTYQPTFRFPPTVENKGTSTRVSPMQASLPSHPFLRGRATCCAASCWLDE